MGQKRKLSRRDSICVSPGVDNANQNSRGSFDYMLLICFKKTMTKNIFYILRIFQRIFALRYRDGFGLSSQEKVERARDNETRYSA